MKNLVFKILLCLVILIITLICTIKLFEINSTSEIPPLPEIEQKQAEENMTSQTVESKTETENTNIKKDKIDTKINKKTNVQEKNKTINIITEDKNTKQYTQEEEDLLKKVPPEKEVIVDKEIKVKSYGKYIFK